MRANGPAIFSNHLRSDADAQERNCTAWGMFGRGGCGPLCRYGPRTGLVSQHRVVAKAPRRAVPSGNHGRTASPPPHSVLGPFRAPQGFPTHQGTGRKPLPRAAAKLAPPRIFVLVVQRPSFRVPNGPNNGTYCTPPSLSNAAPGPTWALKRPPPGRTRPARILGAPTRIVPPPGPRTAFGVDKNIGENTTTSSGQAGRDPYINLQLGRAKTPDWWACDPCIFNLATIGRSIAYFGHFCHGGKAAKHFSRGRRG